MAMWHAYEQKLPIMHVVIRSRSQPPVDTKCWRGATPVQFTPLQVCKSTHGSNQTHGELAGGVYANNAAEFQPGLNTGAPASPSDPPVRAVRQREAYRGY